jgi:hypothetical protein
MPLPDPTASPTPREASKVAGLGLAVWGAVQLAVAVFSRNATALVIVQAVVAEWGAGRMGIAWSDPLGDVPRWKALARRAALGIALGATAGTVTVVVALSIGAAVRAKGAPTVGLLAVGLVVAVLSAVRDELLLRGVVLKVTRGLLPAWAALLACGGAAVAARFGAESAVAPALLIEGLRGVALGAIWIRDRGAWTAVAASAAWSWTLGSVVRGGLVDVRFATEVGAGLPALVTVALAAVAACVWVGRGAATDAVPHARQRAEPNNDEAQRPAPVKDPR